LGIKKAGIFVFGSGGGIDFITKIYSSRYY